MNMYCLIFVCSSMFGTSTVDQKASNNSTEIRTEQIQQKPSVPVLPRLDIEASMKYSEPESMSLPKMGEHSHSSTSAKAAGGAVARDKPAAVPMLLSEMLLPPKSVRSSPQQIESFRN